jgi:VanZ family protein
MASSSLVLEGYPRQASARVPVPLRTQLRAWLPVLACAMLFAVESTSYLGGDRTDAPLQSAAEALFGYGIGVHWDLIHHLLRKTGHFVGYGMFSLVCFRGFWIVLRHSASRLSRQLSAHSLAILVTFLVASADEIHQSFLPNRYGSFSDVLIDTCGAVVLGLVLFLAMQAAWRRKQTRTRVTSREPACAGAAY